MKEAAVHQAESEDPVHGIHIEHKKSKSLRALEEQIQRHFLQGFKEVQAFTKEMEMEEAAAARVASSSSSVSIASKSGNPVMHSISSSMRVNPLLEARSSVSLHSLRRQSLPMMTQETTHHGHLHDHHHHHHHQFQERPNPPSPEKRERIRTCSTIPRNEPSKAEKLGRKASFLHVRTR
jgi:hypothetical protein